MVVTYFITHKPFTPDLAASLGLAFWRVLSAGLIVFAAGGFGYKFLPLAGLHPLARLSVQAAAGLGVMSIGLLLVGSLALPEWFPWLLLAGLLAWLFRSSAAWLKQLSGLKDLWRESSSFGRLVGGILGITIAAALLIALAPPLKFDALMYHLVMPQAYLLNGKIGYLPWIAMTGMPQVTEMLYTWAMALGGVSGCSAIGLDGGFAGYAGSVGATSACGFRQTRPGPDWQP